MTALSPWKCLDWDDSGRLYLLTTVALASTMRLAKRGVLLHNMKSIESLARVDVLCVDKTGTITENTMEVQELVPVVSIENDGTDLTNVEKIGDFCRTMSADNDTMKAMKEFLLLIIRGKPLAIPRFRLSKNLVA